MRATRPYTYLGTVQGMCRQCRALVPARVIEEGGAVFQERLCPTCGSERARIADNVEWYLDRVATTVRCKPVRLPGTPVREGCPKDCGPCAFHANACHLPVFSVTNACNMECPICFTYNRPDRSYFMLREELRSLLDKLIERAAPFDLLNVTGGEPTLHPDILELLKECQRPEIGRVTMNSNGLRLAADADLCRALADLGVYVILSFDTFRAETALKMHGRDVIAEKRRALENLQRFGVGTTLLNVMVRGLNDDEIGDVFALAKSHSVVRSVTVQTMTFTGKGGKAFAPRETMPLDGAAAAIERATGGAMRAADFFAHPGAHPLCYSVAYFLKDGPRWRSFTNFLTVEELRQMIGTGYLLQPDETNQQLFKEAIDRVWAAGDPAGVLPALKQLLSRLYPATRDAGSRSGVSAERRPRGEDAQSAALCRDAATTSEQAWQAFRRQAIAEESILTVYLHSHMDEDTLDLARLVACPDQVPDPEGRLIPACAYNLFYRQKDPRFWKD